MTPRFDADRRPLDGTHIALGCGFVHAHSFITPYSSSKTENFTMPNCFATSLTPPENLGTSEDLAAPSRCLSKCCLSIHCLRIKIIVSFSSTRTVLSWSFFQQFISFKSLQDAINSRLSVVSRKLGNQLNFHWRVLEDFSMVTNFLHIRWCLLTFDHIKAGGILFLCNYFSVDCSTALRSEFLWEFHHRPT